MTSNRIQLDRLLYTHYQHPNLHPVKNFCADFGLIEVSESDGLIYFRGFGENPCIYIAEQSQDSKKHFVGAGWAVPAYTDLEKAAALPSASPIQLSTVPGGGSYVEIPDPNGVIIRLHHGVQYKGIAAAERPEPVITNTWLEKPRRGMFQRFERGASRVHKLGHYGILVKQDDFDRTLEWYKSTFSLVPTDSVYDTHSGADIMTFCHIDKGEQFTDHHVRCNFASSFSNISVRLMNWTQSFFISASPIGTGGSRVHHSSFEVDDVESQTLGHYHLEKQGWTNCWGIGRHVLGSQIFDYWYVTLQGLQSCGH